MIGNTATIYGSYMYPSSTAPQYIPGGATNAVVCLIVAALALTIRYLHKWENKKLEKAEREAVEGGETGGSLPADVDGRDQRGTGFRYIY